MSTLCPTRSSSALPLCFCALFLLFGFAALAFTQLPSMELSAAAAPAVVYNAAGQQEVPLSSHALLKHGSAIAAAQCYNENGPYNNTVFRDIEDPNRFIVPCFENGDWYHIVLQYENSNGWRSITAYCKRAAKNWQNYSRILGQRGTVAAELPAELPVLVQP